MKAILTDVTKCIGCEKCVDACIVENNQSNALPWRWISNDGLSSERFTSIIRKPDEHYIRKQCRHCFEPACVSACPVGALQKTDEGPVIYDAHKCMGCRYCMMSCPFGIPRYSWEDNIPYVRKCTMCYSRIEQGEKPACIEACPEKATIFGEREELIAEARNRISSKPELYIQQIYGEHEVGGTSVLYISDIELDFLGWKKDLGGRTYPSLTQFAMRAVPPVFVGVGAAMYGIYRITERRKKVQEHRDQADSSDNVNDRSSEDES
ncbi:4Fe-4S dicluster domain-containing protein [candidate division KSB1 bacterium]